VLTKSNGKLTAEGNFPMKCAAHKSNGQPCQTAAIHGSNVCRVHGGSAQQVREAARRRLLELVDPALATLERAVRQKGKPDAVAIAAAREILDRAGLAAEETKQATTIQLVVGMAGDDEERVESSEHDSTPAAQNRGRDWHRGAPTNLRPATKVLPCGESVLSPV
jgi:hypothetical protein